MCLACMTYKPSLMMRFFEAIMKPMEKLRPKTVGQATGDVLEVGSGSGLNLQWYGEVDSLVAVEPDQEAMEYAQFRAQGLSFPVEFLETGAEVMPCEDESFDSVVATWVFCTIPQLNDSITEIWRVMKPGAKLFLVEHTRSPHRWMRWLQERLTPLWKRLAGGCHLNRYPTEDLQKQGFVLLDFKEIKAGFWNPFPMVAAVLEKPVD